MDELENMLNIMIQRKSNFSKVNYEIKITAETPVNAQQFLNMDFNFKKIDIVCSEVELDSFFNINNEIKDICKYIEKLKGRFCVRFVFDKCYIKFWNENINLDSHIEFNECKINVNVQDVNIDEIYLKTQNFKNCIFENLSLLSGEVKTVHIDLINASINLFQIVIMEFSDNKANKIAIRNSKINQIMIQTAVFKMDFIIHSSSVNTITIKDVDFESLSEFNEVVFQNEFSFQEITYKGLTLFDKCVFNTKAQFEYIIFEKFASFRGTIFNRGLNLDYTSSDKDINFFGIKGLESKESKANTSQETYRSIKHNLEKIGNKIDANKYHALELDHKRKELKENKWKNKKEYAVFWLHNLSSEHSTNWFLALCWIFFVGILTVFFLHLAIAKDLVFHPEHFKGEYFVKLFDQVLKFIYIGNMEDELKTHPLIFLLNKVSLGYLYYQFLTAVRKDTRK